MTKLCHIKCDQAACVSTDGGHFEHIMVVAHNSVYSSRPSVGGNSGTWGDEAPKSEARRAENQGRGRGGVL